MEPSGGPDPAPNAAAGVAGPAASPAGGAANPRDGGADRTARWLALGILVYFAVSFTFSWMRALELQTSTWDMGTYQQALWSTAQSRPFYTAANLETDGYLSLLQVHTVFVLYPLVPVYSLAPSQVTLFAVQSAVVAVAAHPLYRFARDRTGSRRLALLAGLAYLVWAPTLTSNLYDFHVEALLPLEVFAFVFLWNRERYRAGFAVAAVAFLTLEVTPILLFFVGIFFLLPSGATLGGAVRRVREVGLSHVLAEQLRGAWAQPRVVATIGLLVACLFAYGALEYVRADYLVATLGVVPVPNGGYAVPPAGSFGALGLSVANLSSGFALKLQDWLVYLALLGFVPLLAPRALAIAVPWVAFSFLSASTVYASLGYQYGFLVSCALFVPFVCGLAVGRSWYLNRSHDAPDPRTEPGEARPFRWRRGRAGVSDRTLRLFVVAAIVLLAANLALTPADPLAQGGSSGAAYQFSYEIPAGFSDVQRVVDLLPSRAVVLASADLFPLVANDVSAYSFYWTGDFYNLYVPFNTSHLPAYVLVAQAQEGAVFPWLASTLYDSGAYGVRGIAWGSAAGAVVLFEEGYDGPADEFGTAPSSASSYGGNSLVYPDAAYLASMPGSRFANVVVSAPNLVGLMWLGPDASIGPGTYRVTVWVNATPQNAAEPPAANTSVLGVGSYAFAQPNLYYHEIPFAELDRPAWVPLNFTVTFAAPTFSWEVEGVVLLSDVTISLDYIQVVPAVD